MELKHICGVYLLFLCFYCLGQVESSGASVTGTYKITPGVTRLYLNCSLASGTSWTRVSFITLEKNVSSTWTYIANVSETGITIFDSLFSQRATVTGSVTIVSSAHLAVIIVASQTVCSDATSYQCTFVGDKSGTVLTVKDQITVRAEVPPKNTFDIVAIPNASPLTTSLHSYVPGTVVTLNCTGYVGNPALTHRWCKKEVNDQTFVVYPNTEDINQYIWLEYQAATCDYQRTSALQYNITAEDTQIEFLCEDSSNTMCGSGLFTKTITLRKVKYATLEMTGTDKITPGVTKLEFSCSVISASSSQSVTSISLLKRESIYSPSWKSIVEINKNGTTILDPSYAKRIKSYGSTVNVPDANLHIVIEAPNTKCSDAASYQCVLRDDKIQSIVRDEMNVSVEVKPRGTEDIIASPISSLAYAPKHIYLPGDKVELICTGHVGNPALLHRWCKKGVNDKDFEEYANTDDITQNTGFSYQSDTCDYRRTSTLQYNITEADTRTEFMCEDKTNTECGEGLFTKRILLKKVKYATMFMSGTNKISPGTTQLEVTCSLNSTSSSQSVTSLKLQRSELNNSSDWTTIAKVEKDGLISFLTRAKIFGSVANASSAYLRVIIEASNTKCSDGVSYQCVLQDDVIQSFVRAEMNVGVEVPPRSTQNIVVSPSTSTTDLPVHTYVPGTVVTLTCTGGVGNPALKHRWCKKGANDQAMSVYPEFEDIEQDVSLEYQPAMCEYRRTSQLTYIVTKQDTQTVFMCEDSTLITCGSGVFTKNVTIKAFIQENVETTKSFETTAAGKKSSDEQLNSLSIIFIAVSSVVFLMCCVYAAWKIILRRRQNRDGSHQKTDGVQQIPGIGTDRGLGPGRADTLYYDYAGEFKSGMAVVDTSDGYETLGRYMKPQSYACLENPEKTNTYFVLEPLPDYIEPIQHP